MKDSLNVIVIKSFLVVIGLSASLTIGYFKGKADQLTNTKKAFNTINDINPEISIKIREASKKLQDKAL